MKKGYHDQNLFDLEPDTKPQEKVECLGLTFESDENRQEYFIEKLRDKLKDTEFREIEGFPLGKDEDILTLSDPPYYTACPNPFIGDFIKRYGKPYDPANDNYRREPFAADVSEGKNDPIYNAHSYHTKVPHKAIMRYILHYTMPGDIVFDGFCGTGMTGVAAHMCGDRKTLESLGYQIEPDGTVLQNENDENGNNEWVAFSKLGSRLSILNDLSPAATFIAYNYNKHVNFSAFEHEAIRIFKEIEAECSWIYETKHTDGRIGKINYVVWSDVFVCPECSKEVVFWETAVDYKNGEVKKEFPCRHCHSHLNKRKMERALTTKFDHMLGKTIRQGKSVPVLINYVVAGKRVNKKPDSHDLSVIEKVENSSDFEWFPVDEMMHAAPGERWGDEWRPGRAFEYIHHLLFQRTNFVLSKIVNRINQSPIAVRSLLQLCVTASLQNLSRMYRWRANGKGGIISGTYYLSSTPQENNAISQIGLKFKSIYRALLAFRNNNSIVSTMSSTGLLDKQSFVDYIFLDPPFGSNLAYSELNFLWESWLKIWTNNEEEAIENKTQAKGLNEYRQLMTKCFREAYRILKPGRWMTVEFSNTKASVWNSIQTSLADSGFVVANVSALDKKQGSFKAVTTPTAVKQDLIISAYKPNGGFEERFKREAQTEEGVWDFLRTHMKYLPVMIKKGRGVVPVPERDSRILYDQMVAYYVRQGYQVPISSQEFQPGLAQRFPERDGMYFLNDQAAEYDKKRMTVKEVLQLQLFVSDETSAIQWLRQLLTKKSQTFQDIHPQFLKEISGWQKHEKPLELSEMLEQNYLCFDGKGEVPSQIHSYLSSNYRELRNLDKDDPVLQAKAKNRWYIPDPNKAGDLEKLRERALIREFDEYRVSKQKRLKLFRLEAVRSGFKKAWQERNYETIIAVARKIPENVLQEDSKLLMWYDQALTRTGG